INTPVFTPLIGIERVPHGQIGTVVRTDYLFRVLLDKLRIRIFQKFFVEPFDVLGYIPLSRKLIMCINLSAATLEIVGILYGVHETKILNKLVFCYFIFPRRAWERSIAAEATSFAQS